MDENMEKKSRNGEPGREFHREAWTREGREGRKMEQKFMLWDGASEQK